jgi:hypothetical protein
MSRQTQPQTPQNHTPTKGIVHRAPVVEAKAAQTEQANLKQQATPTAGVATMEMDVLQRQQMLMEMGHTHGNQFVAQRMAQVQRKEGGDGEKAAGAEDKINTQDIQYEIVAHHMGYQDDISDEAGELLVRWGYQPDWVSAITDDSTGLFVGLIMPAEGQSVTPILVFRGTEGYKDIVSDAHPTAVGMNQFQNNKHIIEQMIAEAGGRVDVVGHSLGGALAQHAGHAFPGSIGRVVTFQSPAVTNDQAEEFAALEDKPEVVHHIAGGDLVDTAGGTHLEGTFFRHTPGGGPLSHMKFLLTTPELKERREALGLTDEKLGEMGIDVEENKKPIEQYEEYPHAIKSMIDETVRKGLGTVLYPILNGFNTLFSSDDTKVRNVINETDESTLAKMPVSERAYMVDRLCRGITGNDDEQAILRLLDISAKNGDMHQVVNVVNPWKLCDAVDGDEYDQLREKLQLHYHPQVDYENAWALLQKCMDGSSEWEEEMVADVLTYSRHGRGLIEQVGRVYEDGGDFYDGLNAIEWYLDGAEQKQVAAVFGKSGDRP